MRLVLMNLLALTLIDIGLLGGPVWALQLSDTFGELRGQISQAPVPTFGPFLWRVGVEQEQAPWLDFKVDVGASDLLYRPFWAQTTPGSTPLINMWQPSLKAWPARTPDDSVALVLGQLEVKETFGSFYGGRVMVPWGLGGDTDDAELFLPRSLLYDEGYFPLRDLGVGYKAESNGFYMNALMHQGTGDESSEGRFFVTGQWGYHGPFGVQTGVSLTAGHLAYPLVAEETTVRGANVFFGYQVLNWQLQSEISWLDFKTETGDVQPLAFNVDAECPLEESVNLIGRYEMLNDNMMGQGPSSSVSRGILGMEWHSEKNVSRLFLYVMKNLESSTEINNDAVMLSWRIVPQFEKGVLHE